MKFNKRLFLFLIPLLLALVILSSCGIIPQSPEGKISGRVLIPPSEMSKDITERFDDADDDEGGSDYNYIVDIVEWDPPATDNTVVAIVDADGVTHTVTTDENGYYTFEGIAVNPNTVITATVELNGNTLVIKDVIPQEVTAEEQYDAGDMDPESTALALILEALITSGENPSDVDIDEIKSSDGFLALVSHITSVLEDGGDVTGDPDIAGMIEDIINPPAPPSPPSSPSPTTKLLVYNQTKKTYYNTIQKAINNASSDDIIVVSPGTYKENIVFDDKNITLKSTDPDSAVVTSTIIDGQKQDSVVKILNGDTSTLEGFTIQNGNEPDYGGGGIFVSGSSPVIMYNVIGDNIDDDVDTGNTGYCGGGICVVDYSEEPYIYENVIIGNNGYYGGGMYIGYGSPLVENNTIKENESDSEGGGILVAYSKYDGENYCPVISRNIIEYNKTTNSHGGGIAVIEKGSAIIENNQIKNNETNYNGGGIYIASSSDADIRGNNTIEDNKAGYDGGGIYIYSEGIISITANTINNNIANIDSGSYSGGGIYVNETFMTKIPVIGGTDITDTSNFNTICGNSPDQVNPDSYPNNYFYEIGDTGPAGGIVFYVDEAGEFDWTYLECAPYGWYDGEEDPILAWGPLDGTQDSHGDGVGTGIGNDESDLGAGESNTALILAATGDYPAAEAASAYTGGSQTDWFLPSKSELNLMYTNLHLADLGGFSDDSSDPGPKDFYWSSAESSPDWEWQLAWAIGFADGELGGFGKTTTSYALGSFRVRPIRAF